MRAPWTSSSGKLAWHRQGRAAEQVGVKCFQHLICKYKEKVLFSHRDRGETGALLKEVPACSSRRQFRGVDCVFLWIMRWDTGSKFISPAAYAATLMALFLVSHGGSLSSIRKTTCEVSRVCVLLTEWEKTTVVPHIFFDYLRLFFNLATAPVNPCTSAADDYFHYQLTCQWWIAKMASSNNSIAWLTVQKQLIQLMKRRNAETRQSRTPLYSNMFNQNIR